MLHSALTSMLLSNSGSGSSTSLMKQTAMAGKVKKSVKSLPIL